MKRIALLTLLLTTACAADVRMPALFSNGMVLQQRFHAPIWGWAKPGEKITVTGSWGATATVTANRDGKWRVKLTTAGAGGPYDLTISAANTVSIRDVWLGEVWVCSGQSNMEWPLSAAKNAQAEIAAASYPGVRMFTVARAQSQKPKDDCAGAWQVCAPSVAGGFSAVGYFFARDLHKELGVPIGMIHTSWGGTESELWTSERALRKMPDFAARVEQSPKAMEAYRLAMEDYKKKTEAQDPGAGKWNGDTVDTSGWTKAAVPLAWSKMELAPFDGLVWYRATFTVPEAMAGKNARIELGSIDDQDKTYVNGMLVGSTGDWQTQRAYSVPAGALKAGINSLAVRVLDTGGEGGFVSGVQRVLIGGQTVPITDWVWHKGYEMKDLPPPPPPAFRNFSTLYNAMIAPLLPYGIKGAIWYQGESNVGRAYQYRQAFPAMIANWREDWAQGDFPFYYVQIAPFAGYGQAMGAELREAQRLALAVKNTGMAVTTDITDNINDIHPPNKQDVGHRLALWALAKDYGKAVVYSGPLYSSMKVEEDKIRIRFTQVGGGLVAKGPLAGFSIAGYDQRFLPALAKIEGDEVVVWSPQVTNPVAVRFGWTDAPIPNLFNRAGLPASPFRTDSWSCVTDSVKW